MATALLCENWLDQGGDLLLILSSTVYANNVYDVSNFLVSSAAQIPTSSPIVAGPSGGSRQKKGNGVQVSSAPLTGGPLLPGEVGFWTSCEFLRGDANDDLSVNLADVVFITNYSSRGGPAPQRFDAADANDDGGVNLPDAVYIANYF